MKSLFTLLVIRCLLGMFAFTPQTSVVSGYLTSEEKAEILEFLNSYRKKDSPPAAPMPLLEQSILPQATTGSDNLKHILQEAILDDATPPVADTTLRSYVPRTPFSENLATEEKHKIFEILNSNRNEAPPPAENMPHAVHAHTPPMMAHSEHLNSEEQKKILELLNLHESDAAPPFIQSLLSQTKTDSENLMYNQQKEFLHDATPSVPKIIQHIQAQTPPKKFVHSDLLNSKEQNKILELLNLLESDAAPPSVNMHTPQKKIIGDTTAPVADTIGRIHAHTSPKKSVHSGLLNSEEHNKILELLNMLENDAAPPSVNMQTPKTIFGDATPPVADQKQKKMFDNTTAPVADQKQKKIFDNTTAPVADTIDRPLVPKPSVSGQLSAKQRQKILQYHNYYRSTAIPTAADMPYLAWDEDLARDAELRARKCTYEQYSPTGGDSYGQNLFSASYNKPENSVIRWHDEQQDYSFPNGICESEGVCGHYTQMMLARASRIGCGQQFCGHMYLLACHYNKIQYKNQLPYETGTPCSKCPETRSKCYKNLCISPEVCASMPKLCANAHPVWQQ